MEAVVQNVGNYTVLLRTPSAVLAVRKTLVNGGKPVQRGDWLRFRNSSWVMHEEQHNNPNAKR